MIIPTSVAVGLSRTLSAGAGRGAARLTASLDLQASHHSLKLRLMAETPARRDGDPERWRAKAEARLASLAKPPGALGTLEDWCVTLCVAQKTLRPVVANC